MPIPTKYVVLIIRLIVDEYKDKILLARAEKCLMNGGVGGFVETCHCPALFERYLENPNWNRKTVLTVTITSESQLTTAFGH
jgi:acetone carboxylase gamma subunit